MKTTAIYIQNLCVPCENHCRYCLLSWSGQTLGVDYDRSAAYAKKIHDWLKENRPDLDFQFYFGYSMEHPKLYEAISFLQSLGSVGGEFLQFDGLKFRPQEELREFLIGLKHRGIRLIDLTFYGIRQYHDRFAGRPGDYDSMMEILRIANEIGLGVEVGIPLNHENADQMNELYDIFSHYELTRIFFFVPHGEGRGATLETVRFTNSDYDLLNDQVRAHFRRDRFRPEREWVAQSEFPDYEHRVLALSLTPENMDRLEQEDFAKTIAWLEQLDDDYYAAVPSFRELIQLYGDPTGEGFYSERDLYLKYQRRYIAEQGLKLYDINDECQCFSRRFI